MASSVETATVTASTRSRLLSAALSLFTVHSFAGTSLQMIADSVGVTKAAVYHHFKTREEILAAVIDPAIREMRSAVAAAEDERRPTAQAESMLVRFVDVTIRHRALVTLIWTDAGVVDTAGAGEDTIRLANRVRALLTAHQSPPQAAVNASIAVVGIASAAASPLLLDLPDEVLREYLLDAGRRILTLRRRASKSEHGADDAQ